MDSAVIVVDGGVKVAGGVVEVEGVVLVGVDIRLLWLFGWSLLTPVAGSGRRR